MANFERVLEAADGSSAAVTVGKDNNFGPRQLDEDASHDCPSKPGTKSEETPASSGGSQQAAVPPDDNCTGWLGFLLVSLSCSLVFPVTRAFAFVVTAIVLSFRFERGLFFILGWFYFF